MAYAASIPRNLAFIGAVIIAALLLCGAKILSDARIAKDAYLYAYAPYVFAKTAKTLTTPSEDAPHASVNRLLHARELADETTRRVTMPNVDTLYSLAVFDLAAGPAKIAIPASGAPYASIAFLDPFTDVFHLISQSQKDGRKELFLAGPDWIGDAPEGVQFVRAPTRDVWMLARVLAADADDFAAAHAWQDELTVTHDAPHGVWAPDIHLAEGDPDPESVLTIANKMLQRLPPDYQHRRRGAAFQNAGLDGDGRSPSAYQRLLWRVIGSRVDQALERATASPPVAETSWRRPPKNIAAFGSDDAKRAGVAKIGLGALPSNEALYFSTDTDANGSPLNGSVGYTFDIPIEGLPARSFWSLTVYEPSSDGRYFLFGNSLDRFAIGDRSKHLRRSEDGPIRIILSSTAPEQTENWLPAPDGPFRATLRLYRPDAVALDENWPPPSLRAIGPISRDLVQ